MLVQRRRDKHTALRLMRGAQPLLGARRARLERLRAENGDAGEQQHVRLRGYFSSFFHSCSLRYSVRSLIPSNSAAAERLSAQSSSAFAV